MEESVYFDSIVNEFFFYYSTWIFKEETAYKEAKEFYHFKIW